MAVQLTCPVVMLLTIRGLHFQVLSISDRLQSVTLSIEQLP